MTFVQAYRETFFKEYIYFHVSDCKPEGAAGTSLLLPLTLKSRHTSLFLLIELRRPRG
jgi:hypothetical protein